MIRIKLSVNRKEIIMIILRPHHLLCLQKFTGHGYNRQFTSHMLSLVRKLTSNPETHISLTCKCDHLCSACPNRQNNKCTSSEKVLRMDFAVLDVCQLQLEKEQDWLSLSSTAKNLILETQKFDNICSQCQWYTLCKNTIQGILSSNSDLSDQTFLR